MVLNEPSKMAEYQKPTALAVGKRPITQVEPANAGDMLSIAIFFRYNSSRGNMSPLRGFFTILPSLPTARAVGYGYFAR